MRHNFYSAIFILFVVLAVIFLPWVFDYKIIYQTTAGDYPLPASVDSQPEKANIMSGDVSPFHGTIIIQKENSQPPLAVLVEPAAEGVSSKTRSEPVENSTYSVSSLKDYSAIKFPIFNYHNIAYLPESATITQKAFNVTPKLFEEHLKYFKENGYASVPLDYLTSYFNTGSALPPKVFAITFDDGRVGQYDYAFPILKKYGFSATFFITTEWIDHAGYMSWDNIKEMSEAGMAIGSHSMTHFSMTLIDASRLKWELEQSKKIIEEKINKQVDYLAYPGGSYNQGVIDATIKAGYQGALSVRKVIEQSPKWRYFISRFHADDNMESIISKLGNY
jgi:peptidoglycan/xylan/chitin deacetylase (PgdA/CDA1 family)